MNTFLQKFQKPKLLLLVLGSSLSLLALFTAVYYQNQRTNLKSKAAEAQIQSIEGEYILEHTHEGELETGQSTFDSYLKRDDGSQVNLQLSNSNPIDVAPGSRIRVSGTEVTETEFKVAPVGLLDELPPAQREMIRERLGGNDIEIIQSKSNVLAATSARVIKLAVVLINYQNFPGEPYNKDQIIQEAKTNANSLEKYMEENAYGKIDLQVDVLGYYTLNSFTCSPTYQMASAKASQAGINLDAYQQILLTAPTDSRCSFNGGISDMNRVAKILFKEKFTNPNRWRNYAMHELSHNFGGSHSGNMSCTSGGQRVAMSSTCVRDTNNRLDPFGIMGQGSNQLNVYNKLQMDFVDANQVPTVTSSGTYTIEPLETFTNGVKGIRVNGNNRSYWLEFRQPYGIFDNFAPTDPVVNGISIRTRYAFPLILDTTPNTNTSAPNALASFKDSALGVGKSFYDPVERISIETLSISPTGADVRVTFNASPPTSVTPTTPPIPTPTIPPPSSTPTPTRVPTVAPTRIPTVTPRPTTRPTLVPTVRVATPTPTRIPTPTKAPTKAPIPSKVPTKVPTKAPTRVPTSSPVSSDRTPPSAPINLLGFSLGHNIIYIIWNGSTDNIGVAGYHVVRDNVRIGTIRTSYPRVYYIDTSSTVAGHSYSYKVQAFDAAGNLSSFSNQATVAAR